MQVKVSPQWVLSSVALLGVPVTCSLPCLEVTRPPTGWGACFLSRVSLFIQQAASLNESVPEWVGILELIKGHQEHGSSHLIMIQPKEKLFSNSL